MKRYASGKIYKIQNDVDNKIYVGATTQKLSSRMSKHRALVKKGHISGIYTHMREIGVKHFQIILIESLNDVNKEELYAREDYWIKHFDTVRNGLNSRYQDGGRCEHKKRREICKDCGGSQICEHNRIKKTCKDCGGSQICEHKKQKSQCIYCGGSQICPHNSVKSQCIDCGGSRICEHKKQKSSCKDCSGDKFKCSICNKIYCSASNLKRHLRSKKHKDKLTQNKAT